MQSSARHDAQRFARDARAFRNTARTQISEIAGRVGSAREDVASSWRETVSRAEPAVDRSSIALLRAFQIVLAVILAIPALVTKSLRIARIATRQIEDSLDRGQAWYGQAQDRSDDVREQILSSIHALPRSRRDIRRQRIKSMSGVVGAFGAGLALGWFAHEYRRRHLQIAADEQAQLHAQHVAELDAADVAALGDGAVESVGGKIASAAASD